MAKGNDPHPNNGKGPDYGETIFRRPAVPPIEKSSATSSGKPTMKPGATDGINKPIPETNSTRAPGQWGKS